MKKIFVSPEVFRWECFLSGWSKSPLEKKKRDYEILSHASSLLENPDTADRRGDCVNALNRAIDKRVKLLNSVYKIDVIFGNRKSIDNLEKVGAARRYMLLQINKIRNFFEHRDRRPPPNSDLKVLVELVWYFLKATDMMAYCPRENIELTPDEEIDGSEWISAHYLPYSRSRQPWKFSISLFDKKYSFSKVRGWAEFHFPIKNVRKISDPVERLFCSDGRLISTEFAPQVLSRFFEV